MLIESLASSSEGNCYIINMGKHRFMIEAGLSKPRIIKGTHNKLSQIEFCLLSHEHGDHSKSIKDLCKMGIDCYMSNGTADYLAIEHHRVRRVSGPLSIGDLSIVPFAVKHDAVEPFGYLIYSLETKEKLLFATDTYFLPYEFKWLTHIMIECNYSKDIFRKSDKADELLKRVVKSHFELENVKDFLKKNKSEKLEEVYLMHLSDEGSDEALFKSEIAGAVGVPVYVCGK